MGKRSKLLCRLAAAVTIFVSILSSLIAIPLHAVAATADLGCQPGRTASSQYNFDGWMYPNVYGSNGSGDNQVGTAGQGANGPEIGGVYSTITTYSNYLYNTGGADSNFDWAWVMLTNDLFGTGSGQYAQIGPMSGEPGNYQGIYVLGDDPAIEIEIYTLDKGQDYQRPNTGVDMSIGTTHTYTVLYGNYAPGVWSFEVDGNLVYTTFLNPAPYEFTPTQAQVFGETRDAADQMYGDIVNPEKFSGTNVYVNSSSRWEAIDTSNQATIANSDLNNNFNVQYGFNRVSSSELDIWDNGCPNSAPNGPGDGPYWVGNGGALDAAGTGSQQLIVNGSGTTNGPFALRANMDGSYQLQDSKARVLWAPSSTSWPDYLAMQSDGNLVLYRAWGKSALFSTGTYGYGSSTQLVLASYGNLLLNDSSGTIWSTGSSWDSTNSGMFYGTSKGEGSVISSGQGTYNFDFQTDGNLVLYTASGSVVWNAGTGQGHTVSGYVLDMQTDGNLVEYNTNTTPATPVFCTATGNHPGSMPHMVVNNEGQVIVQYADQANGATMWANGNNYC